MNRDPMVLARNVRTYRMWRGWSVRELAEASGVSERTIARVEKGHGCTLACEEKLSAALLVQLGLLWSMDLVGENFCQVVRAADSRWKFLVPEESKAYHEKRRRAGLAETEKPVGDPDPIQDPAERRRLGLNGLSVGFQQNISASLTAERHVAAIIELYGKDSTPTFGHNCFMNYILSGGARFGLEDQTYDLAQGDAFHFESRGDWTMEPWNSGGKPQLPTLILHVSFTPWPLRKDQAQ